MRWGRGTRTVKLARAGRLSTLSRSDVRRVVRAGRVVRVPAGGVVVRHGGPVDGAYVLLTGEVSVRRGDRQIGHLRAGDVIGEIALVESIMHTASVVADEDLEAIHLTTPAARYLMAELPQFRTALEQTAAERLAHDRETD